MRRKPLRRRRFQRGTRCRRRRSARCRPEGRGMCRRSLAARRGTRGRRRRRCRSVRSRTRLLHRPQWVRSVRTSTQAVAPPLAVQVVSVAAQVVAQRPRLQTCPLGHARPQAPQLAVSVCRLRHAPAHMASTPGQLKTHAPATQRCPAAQAFPHAPQWAGSPLGSTQRPSQVRCPVAQAWSSVGRSNDSASRRPPSPMGPTRDASPQPLSATIATMDARISERMKESVLRGAKTRALCALRRGCSRRSGMSSGTPSRRRRS